MLAALVWLAAAAALSTAGPAALRALGGGASLGPRAMLAAWLAATAAWLLSWAAFLLLVAIEALGPGLKGFLTACVTLAQAIHRNGGALLLPVLAAAAAGLLLRFTWVSVRRAIRSAQWRRSHVSGLDAAGRTAVVEGHRVHLVPRSRPEVYCLPGDRACVVVTQGAVDALTPRELRAVLAHERAHLTGRHHAMVGWVRLLNTAFPGVPLLAAAEEETAVLVEWAADDRAVRAAGPAALAHALGAMAGARTAAPEATLGVLGACPVQRVRRLLTPLPAPRHRTLRRIMAAAAVCAAAAPLVLLLTTTIAGAALTQCTCSL
ncbi:M56 family metallopeptidase [Nocardiopsis coralliicola]